MTAKISANRSDSSLQNIAALSPNMSGSCKLNALAHHTIRMHSMDKEAVREEFFEGDSRGAPFYAPSQTGRGEAEKIGWLFRTVEFRSGLVQLHEM